MRIASYNIQSGGFSGYESSSDKPEKLELLQDAVSEIDADMIGLVDTFRWKEVFNEKDLQQIFGYSYAYHTDMDDVRVDKRIGIAILSKIPFLNHGIVRLGTRNCVRADLKINGKKVSIFTVYLDDLSEDSRLIQIKSLLNKVDGTLAVIMGDLNCQYKEDASKLEKDFERFLEDNPSFKENTTPGSYFPVALENMKRGEVIEVIKHFGFQDARNGILREATAFTPATSSGIPTIFTVDYIFTSKGITCQGFEVLKSGIFDRASDHYPIVTEISV